MLDRIPLTIAFFIILYSFGKAEAQNTFEKEINFEGFSGGKALVQTSDGGFLAGGFKYDPIDSSQYFPFLSKFDQNGNLQWAKLVGNGFGGLINDVKQSIDGNYFAAGTINISGVTRQLIIKFDISGNVIWARSITDYGLPVIASCSDGGCVFATSNSSRSFVLRISAKGTLIWEQNFEDLDGNYIYSMIAFTDTSFLIFGNTGASFTALSVTNIGQSGSVLWSKNISTTVDLFASAVCKKSDGGFAICGRVEASSDNENIYIGSFDPSGSLLWGKEIDAFGFEEGDGITEAQNGDLTVACLGNHTNSMPKNSMILRLNRSGDVLDLKTLSGDSNLNADVIILSSDGSFVLTGNAGETPTEKTGGILLVKIDSMINGCNLENQLFSDRPIGKEISVTRSSTLGNNTLDTADITIGADLTFKEIDLCNISSVSPASSGEESLSLSPNPLISGKSVTIHVNENLPSGIYYLSLLDLLGNTVKKEKINFSGSKQDMLFDVSECAAGIYMIELQSLNDPKVISWVKLVKE
jgi:hypothetical protein